MNLGHLHQTQMGLTFDHLNHCWFCGIGCALVTLSQPWALYRCESPAGHLWMRCPVHRTYASLDSLSNPHLTTARCLCHVDDDGQSAFATLDCWTMDPTDVDRLVHVDTLTLPRSALDVMNRGALESLQQELVFYKTRPTHVPMDKQSLVQGGMRRVSQWFNLTSDALTQVLKRWRSDMPDGALRQLMEEIQMVQRPKRPRLTEPSGDDPMDVDALDDRPAKRQRFGMSRDDAKGKRSRDDTSGAGAADLYERPLKRQRQRKAGKRRLEFMDAHRPEKRFRRNVMVY